MEKSEIEKKYIGSKFEIIGSHPHAGKTVMCISYDKIKGCAVPGLLVKDKKGMQFRVFDLTELKATE